MNKTIFWANVSIFFAVLSIFIGNMETEEKIEHDKTVETIKAVDEQIQELKKEGQTENDIAIKVGEAIKADLKRKKADVIQLVELAQIPLSNNDYNEIDLTPREKY